MTRGANPRYLNPRLYHAISILFYPDEPHAPFGQLWYTLHKI